MSLSILKGEVIPVKPEFLHRLFENAAAKSPDKTALIYSDKDVPKRETKFSEMNTNANQMANALLQHAETDSLKANADNDWIIVVCMKASDDLLTTLLAVWKTGAAYLPIDVGFPPNRIEHILKEAKPLMVIYDDNYPNAKFFANVKSMKFGDLKSDSIEKAKENIPDQEMLSKGSESAKGIILYTSGSSGVPKGVRLRHHTFIHRLLWQLRKFPYAESEQFCIFKTAMTFVDHVAELWCPLIDSRTLIIVPKDVTKNPELLVPILEEYKIERLLAVPTLLRGILMYLTTLESNQSRTMLSNLKMWISSGETLTVQLATEFFDYFKSDRNILANFYGCTELNCDASSFELESVQQLETLERIPLGTPLPNTAMYIVDKNRQPVELGEEGEICCAGVNVSDGYIGGLDTGAFLKNPIEKGPYENFYRTGDYGYIKDGMVYYKGRHDTQIKIRGNRVDVTEVEKHMNELDYVFKSAILVHHSTQVDQSLVAYVSIKNDSSKKTSTDVEKDLKTRMADYMVPQVIIIKEFPYLPNGKVDRQALLKKYEGGATRRATEATKADMDFKGVPSDKMEVAKLLFEIIAACLGNVLRDKISIESNFFNLGGNSLNTVYTVTQLKNNGLEIGITDFLFAENLGEVLDTLKVTKSLDKPKPEEAEANRRRASETLSRRSLDMTLQRHPIVADDKEECVKLLAMSFLTKSDDGLVTLENFVEILNEIWDAAIAKGLSFMAKNDKGEILGISLNFDITEEPEVKSKNPVKVAFEFQSAVKEPFVKERLRPTPGQVFYGMLMGTNEKMSTQEIISVMSFMETEVLILAAEKGFHGVFTTNTNPLTQQLAISVHGYELLAKIQVNQYADVGGHLPFSASPDNQTVLLLYKSLN